MIGLMIVDDRGVVSFASCQRRLRLRIFLHYFLIIDSRELRVHFQVFHSFSEYSHVFNFGSSLRGGPFVKLIQLVLRL